MYHKQGWGSEIFSTDPDPDPAQQKKSDPDPAPDLTLSRIEKKYLYILMKKNIYIIVIAVHQ